MKAQRTAPQATLAVGVKPTHLDLFVLMVLRTEAVDALFFFAVFVLALRCIVRRDNNGGISDTGSWWFAVNTLGVFSPQLAMNVFVDNEPLWE